MKRSLKKMAGLGVGGGYRRNQFFVVLLEKLMF